MLIATDHGPIVVGCTDDDVPYELEFIDGVAEVSDDVGAHLLSFGDQHFWEAPAAPEGEAPAAPRRPRQRRRAV